MLSPHAYFLALAFSDEAFASQDLVGPEALSKLRVVDELMEARVPWKEDVLDLHVFRKSHQTVYGTRISREPLPHSTVRPWFRKLGEVTGMDKICHLYVLRYAAGKAFDSSSTCFLHSLTKEKKHSHAFLPVKANNVDEAWYQTTLPTPYET